MQPLEIQFALKKKGLCQSDLATQLNVSNMAVSLTIRGKCTSDRIMRAIATALGKDHRLVFPEYYLEPPRRRIKATS